MTVFKIQTGFMFRKWERITNFEITSEHLMESKAENMNTKSFLVSEILNLSHFLNGKC